MITFRKAVREQESLLIGLAGGTGSGKTFSALRLAKGMTPPGKRFALIDTEAGRALHYADKFDFDHGDLKEHRPDDYMAAIRAADKEGYPVILIDSMSHEWGAVLDWQEEEFQRMGGRDSSKPASWIKPKMSHKKMVRDLLQVRAHLVMCFRAEPKIDIVKEDGKTKLVPASGPTGRDGWMPICEKRFPFELTASVLLMSENPGYPLAIKVEGDMLPYFPEGKPIDESSGQRLAEWARGGSTAPLADKPATEAPEWWVEMQEAAKSLGITGQMLAETIQRPASAKNIAAYLGERQIDWRALLEKAGQASGDAAEQAQMEALR